MSPEREDTADDDSGGTEPPGEHRKLITAYYLNRRRSTAGFFLPPVSLKVLCPLYCRLAAEKSTGNGGTSLVLSSSFHPGTNFVLYCRGYKTARERRGDGCNGIPNESIPRENNSTRFIKPINATRKIHCCEPFDRARATARCPGNDSLGTAGLRNSRFA